MNSTAGCAHWKRTQRVIAYVIVATLLLSLPACTIPRLNPPVQGPPLPESFGETSLDEGPKLSGEYEEVAPIESGSTESAASADSSGSLPWNEFFQDQQLISLIDQALVGNQELRILRQEVQIARYEIQARRAAILPFIRFGAGAGLEKSSRFTREGAVEEALEAAPGKGFPDPVPDFLVAANLSWEIDIWRQLRNARDAASLRFLATQEGQNYVVTRMVAEIAENYYELMALDNRLATLDATIAIQEQSLQVARQKKAAGQGTELAVQRFQAEVRKNQSRKYLAQQQIIQVENRINFLLGRNPQPIERPSNQFLDLPLPPLSVGVPAQLLQNRPDIRQAERELSAAGLDVLVARAEFFPKFDITSGVGLNAFNTAYLLTTPESLIYSVAGELTAPLINRAAIRAEYLSANARQLQAVYKYQQTVLNAFVEVVNGMNRVKNLSDSIQRKREQVRALERSVDAANRLFVAGESDYIEVLLAQRELQEARLELIESRQQQLAAVVNTYQALGGGGTLPGFPIMPDACPPRRTWEDWVLRPFERLQPFARRPFGLGGFRPFKRL